MALLGARRLTPRRRRLGRVRGPSWAARTEERPIDAKRPEVAVGAVVLDSDRRLLVVQRGRAPAQGRWTVPGGRVEAGERLVDAVAREVLEETSLIVEVGDVVGHAEIIGSGHHVVVLDFAAQVVSGEAVAGDDADAVAWLGRAALVEAGPTDGLLAFLDEHGVELAP